MGIDYRYASYGIPFRNFAKSIRNLVIFLRLASLLIKEIILLLFIIVSFQLGHSVLSRSSNVFIRMLLYFMLFGF